MRIGKDPVATDYVKATHKGGKRRMDAAMEAEVERHRQEAERQKAERKMFNLVAETPTVADCSCGWTYVNNNGFLTARAAVTHAILHGNVTVNPVNRIGEYALRGAN